MALTKVSGGILDPGIDVAGIVTATGFDGPFTGGSSKNITAGVVTATSLDLNGNGDISGNLVIGGNLTANGDFTTLNTTLREVELLKVDAQNDNVAAGIITQRGTGDILNLYDGATKVVTVEDGGDVIAGVGDLATHTGSRRRLAITDTNNGALLHIRGQSPALFFDQSGGNIGKIYQDNAHLGIYAGRPDSEGANTVRITNDGNVGINQTSPEYKLVINEENTVGTAHTIIGASLNPIIYLDAGNEVDRSIIIKKHTTSNGAKIGGLVFASSPDGANYSWAGIKAIQDTNAAAESLVFYTSTSNTSGANSNEVVRIKGNSVGIGSDDPLSAMALDVVGSIRYSNQLRGAAGSESEPSYAFYADHDSGMYRGGTNILSFATAGSNRLDIAADGTITVKNTLNVNTRANVGGASVGFSPQNSSWATAAALNLKGNYGGGISFNDNDNNGYSMYAEGNGQNFFIKNGAVGGSLKSSIKCIKDGGVQLYHNDNKVAETGQDALYVYGRTANSGMVEIASNLGANNNDRFRIHKTSAASRLTIQNYASGSWVDNIRITAGGAVELKHSDGTNHFETTAGGAAISNIQNNEGLNLNGVGNNTCIKFLSTGSSPGHGYRIAYHSTTNYIFNSPAITFDKIATNGNFSNHIAAVSDSGFHLADNKKLHIGGTTNSSSATGDFQIYHQSSDNHTYIANTTGNVFFSNSGYTYIDQNYLRIRNASGSHMLEANSGGSNQGVRIFHTPGASGGGVFKTTSTGIEVTGEVAASQDYPIFRPTLDFNFAAEKKLDPRITFQRTGSASFLNKFGKVVLVGDNTPRFDYDTTTVESLGLLIEESRTNMLWGTRNMGSSGRWAVGGARGSQGENVEGPDGTLTALQNVYNGTSGDLNIYYTPSNITTTNSTVYTFSVFAKAAPGNSYINGIRLRSHTPNRSVSFNVINGTVGATNEGSSSISEKRIIKYPNGWYRCIMTYTSGTDGNQGIQIYVENEGGNAAALNNSSANGEAMYFWGAQHEEGSFITSYIPTPDFSTATRGTENVKIDGDDFTDFYNQSEGTLVSEFMINDKTTQTSGAIANINALSSGSYANSIMFMEIGTISGYYGRVYKNSSGTGLVGSGNITTNGIMGGTMFNRVSFAWSDTVVNEGLAAYRNGVVQATNSTESNTPTNMTEMRIGQGWGSQYINAHIKRFMYYPKRLPDNQLATLTA